MYIQYTAYGLFNSVSNGFHFISQNNLFPNPLLYFIFGDILFYLLNLIPLQAFTGSLIHKSVVAYTYRVRYFVRTYTTKTAVRVVAVTVQFIFISRPKRILGIMRKIFLTLSSQTPVRNIIATRVRSSVSPRNGPWKNIPLIREFFFIQHYVAYSYFWLYIYNAGRTPE